MHSYIFTLIVIFSLFLGTTILELFLADSLGKQHIDLLLIAYRQRETIMVMALRCMQAHHLMLGVLIIHHHIPTPILTYTLMRNIKEQHLL